MKAHVRVRDVAGDGMVLAAPGIGLGASMLGSPRAARERGGSNGFPATRRLGVAVQRLTSFISSAS